MTPPSPPKSGTSLLFTILDAALPDQPPLAYANDYAEARRRLTRLQEAFCCQLQINGEGGHTAELALVIAAAGDGGLTPCFWSTINGLRPDRRDCFN